MECPKRQFQNGDGAKFCNECGFRFTAICQKSNITNLPGIEFCNECGCDLKAPFLKSAFLKTEEIPQLTIADQKRKYVIVLFSDLSGYTAMTEKLDTEETKEIMGWVNF